LLARGLLICFCIRALTEDSLGPMAPRVFAGFLDKIKHEIPENDGEKTWNDIWNEFMIDWTVTNDIERGCALMTDDRKKCVSENVCL